MCMYITVYIKTYIHIYIYTYIHIYTYTYIYISAHININIYTYLYTYIHIYTHTNIYIYIHMQICIFMYKYIYIYKYCKKKSHASELVWPWSYAAMFGIKYSTLMGCGRTKIACLEGQGHCSTPCQRKMHEDSTPSLLDLSCDLKKI